MNTKYNISTILLNAVIVFGLIININACSTGNSPIAPKMDTENTKKINILKFKKVSSSLNKIVSVSKTITVEEGGVIELRLVIDDEGSVYTNITLEVLPNTLSEDTEISITIDDESIDFIFSPHGTIFSQPAILNIYAMGLDLSGVDPNEIGIFYDNPDTGQWEQMENEGISVNISTGHASVQNAKIPHFSRYAIATD